MTTTIAIAPVLIISMNEADERIVTVTTAVVLMLDYTLRKGRILFLKEYIVYSLGSCQGFMQSKSDQKNTILDHFPIPTQVLKLCSM